MKILNLLLALTLVLAPFFSQSQEVSNIFEDGTVNLENPGKVDGWKLVSPTGYSSPDQYCLSQVQETEQNRNVSAVQLNSEQQGSIRTDTYRCEWDAYGTYGCPSNTYCSFNGRGFTASFNFVYESEYSLVCPPDDVDKKTFSFSIYDDDNKVVSCGDPAQISQVDSCNSSTGLQFLSLDVGEPSVCYSQPDGSICKYNGVDSAGSGNEYYAMDLEGDCYSEQLPSLNGTPQDTPTHESDNCTDWGGTGMICPENPEDVCDVYGNCQEGCGSVNGIFACFDNDLDGDDIPDYLDPDIDGDGIRNEDDLDNDGDGQDDPIDNSGNGNNQGSGGGEPLDLSPVVNKLQEIKKSISETSITRLKKPTENAVSFWESDYPEGITSVWSDVETKFDNTEYVQFISTFNPTLSGGSPADMNFCFNLGSMGDYGCHALPVNSSIWSAIRIFILVSAGFLCRRIIFGG